MSIDHHPSEERLLDYVSGSLGESWSLAVATHLALCPTCRNAVARLEAVGGGMMDATEPAALADDSFDALWSRLESEPDETDGAPAMAAHAGKIDLPEPLRSYVGGSVDALPWQNMGLGVRQLLIPTADQSTARLLCVPAGKPVPEHTHRGEEVTLVLHGAFHDSTGTYAAGDFQEADETVLHQPHAEKDRDCICLAVTDAPLKFRNLAFRLVQPFIGI